MGLNVVLRLGTGKAKCKLCGKLIEKEEVCIYVSGYQTSCYIHRDKNRC